MYVRSAPPLEIVTVDSPGAPARAGVHPAAVGAAVVVADAEGLVGEAESPALQASENPTIAAQARNVSRITREA
jgi:hypothetical protein